MARQNIYTQMSVASVMPPSMIHDLLGFLITNRAQLLAQDKQTEAFRTRSAGSSYLSDIAHRIVAGGKDRNFSLLRLTTKSTPLREAVDLTFLPIDILQMKVVDPTASTSLSVIPNLDDKLVVNITDITRATGDFSNVTEFHHRVVRDFLSRSYYASTGNIWISPALVRYVAKVYSMTIGGRIARRFGLSVDLQGFVTTLFCLFFVGKMTSSEIAVAFCKAHGKTMRLPPSASLDQIFAFVHDTLGKDTPETLEDVFQVIDAYHIMALTHPNGVSRLNRPVLSMQSASLASDGHTAMIAMEYPPYFLFMILQVLSHIRIGLTFPIKDMSLLKEGQEVVDQWIRSPTLLAGL